jgi:hypothetical protein
MYFKSHHPLFILFLILSFTQPLSFANDSDFVKLKKASSFYWSGGGHAGRAINFLVRVKNVGYHKNVNIVFHEGDFRSSWKMLPLRFSSHHGNYDVFSGSLSLYYGGDIKFAIKYEVNGNTYWSNNNGNNFLLPARDYFLAEGNVVLDQSSINGNYCAGWMTGCVNTINWKGTIYVKNRVYQKDVGIAYSVNGGEWQDLKASYIQNSPNQPPYYGFPNIYGDFELWKFSTSFRTSNNEFPKIRFAVYFKPDWDNNFGQDYFIRVGNIERLF